jgi:hypothetical protein
VTTTYRVLVQCDEMNSAWCAGMLELSGPTSRVTSEAAFFPLEQGWLRGYGVDQLTYDVCPACQTEVTQRVIEVGGPFPRVRLGLPGKEERHGQEKEAG